MGFPIHHRAFYRGFKMNVPTFEEYISDKENEWNHFNKEENLEGMLRIEREIQDFYDMHERLNNKQKGNE